MKLSEKIEKKFTSFKRSTLAQRLARLTRICENMDIAVLIMVDGFESSGRGYVINDICSKLNPKYYDVEVFENKEEYEDKFPTMKRFFENTPQNGHIKIFAQSFYYKLFNDLDIDEESLSLRIESMKKHEKMLYDSKMIIVKIFLNIDQKTQEERMRVSEKSTSGHFYISSVDKKQNKNYEAYKKNFEKILNATNFPTSPWHIIDSIDKKDASKEALGLLLDEISMGIERVGIQIKDEENIERDYEAKTSILSNIDLEKTITDEEYKKEKKALQKQIRDMAFEYYQRGISTILVFEGVDAAGKDGAIERLVKKIDPRLYKVFAISAPSKYELAHHYLRRFYKDLPEDGYLAIFSRSWYGRVMVERIEGFAKTCEWNRAYDEILAMEKEIYNHGSLILKFFVSIDKDEQYKRLKARENTPDKLYKITDEDWRNRAKWDEYIKAMDEMLARTNKAYAPWIIVEGKDKKYARIKVMKEYLKYAKAHLEDMDKKNNK